MRCVAGAWTHALIFAWPNSRTAVMGGAQAGKVLRIVTEAEAAQRRLGARPQGAGHAGTGHSAQKLDSQSTALYGSANLWMTG